MPSKKSMKKKAAKPAKRQPPPDEVPGFNAKKDDAVVRVGRSVFLYGQAKPNAKFRRLRDELQVDDVCVPLKSASGPSPKKEIVFRTWQAAERFFAKEFNLEDEKDRLLAYGPGSTCFDSPLMAAGFAQAIENSKARSARKY